MAAGTAGLMDRADEGGKVPVAGGEEEGSSSFKEHQAHLIPVFCDVCGDPKPASGVCFDVVGCPHVFCFECLTLRAEDDGGDDEDIVPCPVPGCTAGFLDQVQLGSAPTASVPAKEALTYFCPICLERKPAEECFLDLRGCDHVFCAECVAGYVAAKVGENDVAAIRCPDPGCRAGRLEPEACRSVISAPVFERWGAALCEVGVGEAARFYCPYPDCSALLWREEDEGDGEGGQQQPAPMVDALCGHCQRVCCAHCRVPWHRGQTCEEYRRAAAEREEEKQVMEMAKEKQWQRCPKCGFLVERVEGCVFIQCRCKHCFCYRCASPMDPGDRKHYCHKCHLTWETKV